MATPAFSPAMNPVGPNQALPMGPAMPMARGPGNTPAPANGIPPVGPADGMNRPPANEPADPTTMADAGSPDATMPSRDGSVPTDDPGNGPYSPCPPAGEDCKVLPLGDSITFGLGVSGGGGYRIELFRKAVADNKSITFVGSERNGPGTVDGQPFPQNHEGHSGWVISQIAGLVPDPALSDEPHIVLLMIGTNDMYRGDPSTAPGRLDDLIDDLVAAVPDALIVVAQLTPLSFSNAAVEAYNAALPEIIDAHAAAGEHVILVDMFTGFSTSMLADGVHPDEAGYAHMAEVWYEAIADVLP